MRSKATLALVSLLVLPLAALDPAPEALIEAGHWKRARAVIELRAAATPNDPQAVYLLSQIKAAFGDFETALQLAERAVALDASKADYHFQLARVCGQMARGAGFFQGMRLGGRFRSEAERAITLDSRHVNARYALMEFYWEAPGIAGGDKKKARQIAEEIIRLEPTRGYLAQAELAAKENHYAELEGFYLRAIEADPRSIPARMALANFYASPTQKKFDLAEKQAREAIKLDVGRAAPYALLAVVYAQQQRWQDLDLIFKRAEKEVPDNLGPHYQAGRALLLDGRELPRAEGYFRKYLSLEPEGYSPTHAHARWRLAQVLEKQGRKSEAIAELENALRLKPDLEDAQKDLKRLKSK